MVAPESASTQERFYLPELDTLRFVAFLTVFLHHSLNDPVSRYVDAGLPQSAASMIVAVLRAGMFGVDLFFLLSSFLITSLLVREYRGTGTIDVKGFWIRRSLRIWPLYFAFVGLAGFVLPRMFHFVAPPEKGHVLGLLTFTHNWAIAFSDAGRGSPTLVLWSVSLEEQFYFTWPLLIVLAGIQRLRHIAIGMILIAVVGRIFAIASEASWYMLWTATPLRMEPIAVGALVALISDRLPAFGGGARLAMIVAGFSIPVACMSLGHDTHWGWALILPLVTIGCLFVFLAIYGSACRLLTWTPLVYLGKISYGLYVFHALAIQFSPRLAIPGLPFGRTISAFLLTVILAALSYQFLERPFLRLKDRFAHVPSRPA
ncbi:acyltransferase family protein [Luteitalea sp.]|jgi:peptidoglycan/LPS O-acetylase OafA/YrhL|uniref:acyltransferase family protein n=1 Tax=Luteitalea sp. TaxID=2004800 RepID=UPI0037C7B2AE